MRPILIALGLLIAIPAGAQEQNRVETENLAFEWQGDAVSEEGLALAKELGERHYGAIAGLLGYAPKFRVTIVLEGPAERPDGSWGYPRVDGWGRIHLYRFGPTPDTYFSALAHELVHVFRIHRRPHHDWFFEEGFAEFVARRVDDGLEGFPWYGFDPVLVAGQWVVAGEDIPIADLRSNHEGLNQPCKLQSYSLRYSFFAYLGREFGDKNVIGMAAREKAGALEDYPEFLGLDFFELAAAWRTDLTARYHEVENADELAQRYRAESPAQYQHVCRDEGD